MNIAILGHGKYGTAIGSLLASTGHSYTYIERLTPIGHHVDVLFIAIPTQSIRDALEKNCKYIDKKTIIVNCSKGVEENTHLLPHLIVDQVTESRSYFSFFGPSFADELVDKMPTVVSLGYREKADLSLVRELLETPYCKISSSPEYQSIELAGAMKNVYAILCGYASGLGFKDNTHARLTLGALREVRSLSERLGYTLTDMNIPAIAGDLVLTCSSKTSRNYSYGYNLATQGDTNPHEGSVTTVEGFHTSGSISAISKRAHTSLPLAELVVEIVGGKQYTRGGFVAALRSSGH